MAAATVYSSLFDSAGVPTKGRPFATERGAMFDRVSYAIATTSIDDVGDRVQLIPVPHGVEIVTLNFECGDLDTNGTPLLDMDIVLSNGVAASDVILYNAGTAFTAALGTTIIRPFSTLARSTRNYLTIDLYVNAAAATAAAGTIKLVAQWLRTQ